MIFIRNVRILISAVGLAAVFVCGVANAGLAQSVEGIVAQTGRAVSKTVRSAQGALSDAASGKSDRARSRRSGGRSGAGKRSTQLAATPPVPVRRPRAWDNAGRRIPAKAKQKHSGAHQRDSTGKAARTGRPTTATPPSAKPAKVETKAAPVVDEWSKVEVNIAHARCQHLLKQINAVVIAQPAIKKGPCGDAAPVKLISLGRSPQVAVSPPAIVNCRMVHALHNWLESDLQPLAKKQLGAKIIAIETMSSYSCRNAYGRKTTRLSEHGRANALDIRGFVTASGKRARLLEHWGPTQRAIAHAKNVAKKKAAEKARLAAEKKALEKARLAARKTGTESGADRLRSSSAVVAGNGTRDGVPLPVRGTIIEGIGAVSANGRATLGVGPSKLGGPKGRKRADKETGGSKGGSSAKKKGAAVARTGGAALKIPRVSNSRQAQFLRAAFKSGCRRFGTMLGPEANHAHRNHFHVDLAPRKRGNYCE